MFAISWPAYVLLLVGFGAIVFAVLAPGYRDPDPAPPVSNDAPEAAEEIAPAPVPEAVAPRRITWPALIDGSPDDVPPESRVRLVEGLGQLAAGWCGPMLTAAYAEEDDGRVKDAILRALRDADFRDCDDVVAAAVRSDRVAERVLAVELADAFDVREVLDAALLDQESVVAMAAVYALKKRMNGSLLSYVERHVSRERAARLLNAIRVLT